MDFSGTVEVLHVLVRLRAPVAAMLGVLAASPAASIVGGAENAGPLGAASLMVLSSTAACAAQSWLHLTPCSPRRTAPQGQPSIGCIGAATTLSRC